MELKSRLRHEPVLARPAAGVAHTTLAILVALAAIALPKRSLQMAYLERRWNPLVVAHAAVAAAAAFAVEELDAKRDHVQLYGDGSYPVAAMAPSAA